MKYGLLGEHLSHSYSPLIHSLFGDYEYCLFERSPHEVEDFLKHGDFQAINVTIPYKKAVIPYLSALSERALKVGSVNVVIRRPDGTLYGDNSDYGGFASLVRKSKIKIKDKKVLILGTGGTSKTAQAVCESLGVGEIIVVSRKGEVNYENLHLHHADADFIINTTPSGMYPDCGSKPIDITPFTQLEGVVDAVYNPLRTNLVLDAKERGIKAECGLYMLVMQAVVAVEKFLDTSIPKEQADRVFADIFASKENIVLTGMPGSGKSTVGNLLHVDGFEFIDIDAEVEKRCGCSIKEMIQAKGETYFRDLETEVIRDVSSQSCRIISTGGGAILREENVRLLRQNGKLFFLDADLNRLQATASRPLSDTPEKLQKLYAERIDIYRSTAHVIVPDLGTAEKEASYIMTKRKELIL